MTQTILEVSFDKLHLDVENPRLPTLVERTPKGIITWIAKTTAIEDLMSAIATNGFFPGEPLVVYPCPTRDGHFIVIEGNRRLTAVKLIQDPYACDKPTSQMLRISQDALHKPEILPVVVQPSRDQVLPYLGFRHITGIKEWEPLAKARYIKQLFDITSNDKPASARYSEVAKTIGSRRDNIKRNLDALAVYGLIENKEFFDIDGLSEQTIKFAILSTALADEKIAEFVGVAVKSQIGDELVPTDPIIDSNVLNNDAIEELTRWLFEKKNGRTVLGESRNLRQLASVVATPRALETLRAGSSLTVAYHKTTGVKVDFMSLIYSAQSSLAEASSLVADVDYDSEAEDVLKSIRNQLKVLGETLVSKRTKDESW